MVAITHFVAHNEPRVESVVILRVLGSLPPDLREIEFNLLVASGVRCRPAEYALKAVNLAAVFVEPE
jgi:hypothetical protein